MRKFLTYLLFSFSSVLSVAQTKTNEVKTAINISEQLNTYLLSALNTYHFNGVALVAKNGTPIFHKAYGWRDVAKKAQNDTVTIFPVLSITKSFTAVVMLKLQEEGKLSLQDTLSKYLPDYPQAGKIRLEHLLTHSSGVYNYTNDFDEEDSAIVNHPVPRQMVLDRFYNKPLEFEPGNQFSYNNSGYFLAGLVIEKATGKPYEQNVREIIFEPLNMNRSGFHYNGLPAGSKATGYQFLNAAVQKQYTLFDSTVGYAAGSIYSTSANLLKWARAIMERKILGQASWDTALTSRFNGYGYGFQTGDFEGKNYIRLTGGYPGFVSEMMLYPKDSVSLILLKNVADYGQDLFALALEVSNIAFEKPYDLWQTRTPVILPEAVLKEYEGRYKLNNKSVAGEIYSAFVLKESHLYMVTPSGTEFLLTPAGNDTFFNENYNSLIRFSRDKKGAVVKLTSRERGTNAEWNRIK